jgi:hypothetical protein
MRIAFGKSFCSSFHQINSLSRPKDDPLTCLDIAQYRPQAESHVERMDPQGCSRMSILTIALSLRFVQT